MQDEKTFRWFERHGVAPPSRTSHDMTPDDIISKLQPLQPHSWRLEGNRLIAKTGMGELVNHIDPGYIMVGTDSKGLPTFRKIIE